MLDKNVKPADLNAALEQNAVSIAAAEGLPVPDVSLPEARPVADGWQAFCSSLGRAQVEGLATSQGAIDRPRPKHRRGLAPLRLVDSDRYMYGSWPIGPNKTQVSFGTLPLSKSQNTNIHVRPSPQAGSRFGHFKLSRWPISLPASATTNAGQCVSASSYQVAGQDRANGRDDLLSDGGGARDRRSEGCGDRHRGRRLDGRCGDCRSRGRGQHPHPESRGCPRTAGASRRAGPVSKRRAANSCFRRRGRDRRLRQPRVRAPRVADGRRVWNAHTGSMRVTAPSRFLGK